jgi:hypothetical protein
MIGTPQTREVAALVGKIRPFLAGHAPEVQGAVLADLLAVWLAGHHTAGDADASRKFRADLLDVHCRAVRQLVEVNAKIMGTEP